jgi:beta-phosphoglucomutase-like phosphatase (HAD superfamily)
MADIDALIFDFDGLIIDSETPLFEIWQDIYREHGGALAFDDWQHALGTVGGFDPYADLLARTGVRLERETLAPIIRTRHVDRCKVMPLLPGVGELIDAARAAGLRTAVASSSAIDWVGPFLEQHGLFARLDAVCTRDDVTRVKPAPDLFLLAAERLGVEASRCVVFEDSPNGLRAARAAGMWAVAVPNALTRALPMPDPDLVLDSLAVTSLDEILAAVTAAAARVP